MLCGKCDANGSTTKSGSPMATMTTFRLTFISHLRYAPDAVRTLSERFDELDHAFSAYMARHPEFTEWAGFRARLFEEPAD